uniref:L-rhamnose-binding lectin CSL3-like n=1 Tax=Fundulus heteroclitus TaxID=8078 RepID=A0A3Q2PNL4_FUNHE
TKCNRSLSGLCVSMLCLIRCCLAETREGICLDFHTKLQCFLSSLSDKGQLISVSRATYGRSDQKTCSSGRPVQQTTNVQCSGNADKVAQRYRCWVFSTGQPCLAFLQFSKPDGPTVACEGSVAQLQCDKGQLISVSRATYGRSDQKTCSSGRPANQLTNVQCSGNADKVAQSCNGKQSCSIRAANSVFGDPCVGTYKYLEVDYLCYGELFFWL